MLKRKRLTLIKKLKDLTNLPSKNNAMKRIKFSFLILLLIGCNNSKEHKQADYKPSQEVIALNDTAVSIYEEQLHEDTRNILILKEALSYLNKAITLDSSYVYSYLNKISI